LQSVPDGILGHTDDGDGGIHPDGEEFGGDSIRETEAGMSVEVGIVRSCKGNLHEDDVTIPEIGGFGIPFLEARFKSHVLSSLFCAERP